MGLRVHRLRRLFDLNETIYFEGRLYERLTGKKYKYRVILDEDDYDYVVIPALKKRLDRAFRASEKGRYGSAL